MNAIIGRVRYIETEISTIAKSRRFNFKRGHGILEFPGHNTIILQNNIKQGTVA